MARRLLTPLAIAGFVVAIALVPMALDTFQAFQFALVAIFVIAIAGVNILIGYTGQISLGHGGFMAIGAYTTVILVSKHGFPYWTTIPLAALVAGVAGLAFGLPALRLSGLYLALATFGFAVAVPAIAKHFKSFTGGDSGLGFLPVGAPSGTGLSPNDWYYYLSWGCALVAIAVAWLVVRGKLGRAFRAIRDSEVAAVSSGISLAIYKTLAFGVSAAFAGVAGSLYAVVYAYVSPSGPDPIKYSLYLVIGAVVAGLGSLWGLVIGAGLIQFLPVHAGDISRNATDFFFGAVLVLVILLFPRGAAGLLRTVTEPLGRLYTRTPPEQGASE